MRRVESPADGVAAQVGTRAGRKPVRRRSRTAGGAAFGMLLSAFVFGAGPLRAEAQNAVVQHPVLAPDLAVQAATAALAACRKAGYQVAVTVVDRFGLTQVVLRDRFAGAHTLEASADKAWTAASFRMSTAALAIETQAGRPMSAIRGVGRVLALGGGLPIEAGGAVLGAIGVSGAPGGEADEGCARAGIEAVREEIEFR